MKDYPLISDYIEAIKAAEDNFEQLKHLRPVLGVDGNPVISSGNFAVVFKMKDENTGKFYAVKCFLKEQEGREDAYRLISEELNSVNSPYLTPIKYLDKELFVDSRNTDDTEFPVLLMDWVEGTPLDKYIQVYVNRYQRAENLDEVTESQEKAAELIANAYELDKLSYQFSRLAVWLLKQPFAHGDLKPDNIMVKEDGAIVLVDYDGMYVPAMKGQKARELGSPDFRHPLRTIDDFDEHIDDFPLSSILLSLLAIATRPALFDEFGDDGRLLFTESDYRNLAGSSVLDAIKPLIEDKHLTTYLSLFYLCSAQKSLFKESYHLFYLPEPIKPSFTEDESMSTKVSRDDFVHPWMDVYGYDETESYKDEEYGLLYDEDKRRLLRCSFQITVCTIIEGTKIICDHAFLDRNILSVQIPESVMAIGKEAFCHCHRLESITIPEGVHMIGDYAFANCYKLATIHLPESLNVIGDDIFYNCNRLSGIYIPKGFKSIYDALLPDYKNILIEEEESEDISTEVTEEDLANAWTDEYGVMYSADRKRLLKINKNLWEKEKWHYSIYEGTKVICNHAFHPWSSSYRNCGSSLLDIPDSVLKIGESALMGIGLSSIVIPKNVKEIGSNALAVNPYLETIVVDEENPYFDSRDNCNAIIKTDSNELVIGCKSTIIPSSVTKIGRNSFSECYNLVSIDIPNSVTEIGEKAFYYCDQLYNINLPQTITTIDSYAFEGSSLAYIYLGDNIKSLGVKIFEGSRFKRIYASKKTQDNIKEITHEYDKYFDDTVSTIYDFNNAYEDEFGAKYSNDKLRLLSIPKTLEKYCIKDGTEYICDYAFVGGSRTGLISAAIQKYKVHIISITLPTNIIAIGKNAFAGCDNITTIYIPLGTKEKFEELLPEYKDKLVEKSNIVSIIFDNNSASKVDRFHVFKKNNDWKLVVVYKNGMKIEYPYSLLQGNQSIVFDKQTIEKIQLYVGNCEGFYINPKAVKVDFEYPAKYTAKILFDSDYIEINGITWGLNNNINEWKVKGIRSFNIEERLAVKRAEVVPSDYGSSVCFFMNAGGQTYIPLDKNSELCVGDALDMNTAKIITLCRKGKSDIVRVME